MDLAAAKKMVSEQVRESEPETDALFEALIIVCRNFETRLSALEQ